MHHNDRLEGGREAREARKVGGQAGREDRREVMEGEREVVGEIEREG